MNYQQIEAFAKETLPYYLEAAAWADTPEEADEHEGFEFSAEAEHMAFIDCLYFVRKAYPWFDDSCPEDIGHNLWLSRQGHGTGFWDRGHKHGNHLHTLAEKLGDCDVYLSAQKDGVLYLEIS